MEKDLDLARLLAESRKRVAAMSSEELSAMHQAQRESWARSITEWPKPKFDWIDGVKVYASYEDYCND
ncbi:hypothetical protein [Mesorhizobium sp. URHB0026]